MRTPRFTDEQMVTILREADAKPVPDVAKKHGVRAQTIYSWRKHCGSLEPSDVTRVRQLEQENGRLKKMVADRDLEIDVLKEITRNNGRRTRAPAAGRVDPITRAVRPPRVRRALGRAIDVGLPGAAVRDAPAVATMRHLAAQSPRDGYRRSRLFLRREGDVMSPDRTHRLWRHAGLQVPRRRVASGRPRPWPPTARHHVWAYDFVFDTCATRQTRNCLTIVDEWTRECLAIDVAGGIRAGRVIELLWQRVSVPGAPRSLRSDHGLPQKSRRQSFSDLTMGSVDSAARRQAGSTLAEGMSRPLLKLGGGSGEILRDLRL